MCIRDRAKTGETYNGRNDPGVLSVHKIYNYYKKHGYKTIVMGASFRNVDEIKNLAGVDYLTISPNLLDELLNSNDHVPRVLDVATAKKEGAEKISYIDDEATFRFSLNEDAMGTEKLAEGIRKFSADIVTLFDMIEKKVTA